MGRATSWKILIPLLTLAAGGFSLWPGRLGMAASPGQNPALAAKEARVGPGERAGDPAPADRHGDRLPGKAGRLGSVQREVDQLVHWVTSQGGEAGVLVRELGSGRVLAQHGQDRPLNPASNAKLVTAAAALDALGSEYRFTTGVYGSIENGRAERLVLRGHGDPSLTTASLWDLGHALTEMGLEQVGVVEVDGTRFDESFVPPAFDQQPDEWASFRAPISAVALERNTVTINVMAGRQGEEARVWVDPPGFVELQGTIVTRARGSREAVRLALSPSGPRLVAKMDGHVPAGSGRLRFTRRVDDPTLFAGYVFRDILRRVGVRVDGEVRRGTGAEKRRLVYVSSAPLRELLDSLGKESDNFYAEMVFKALGAEHAEGPARSADGAAMVVEWLKKHGGYPRGSRITNGSGLFDANRLSASALVNTLVAVYDDQALRPEFLSHLAKGGVDGTLRSRFTKGPARARVRAKTGTLARVDALSGYVLAPQRKDAVAFAILVNGVAAHQQTRRRVDDIVAAVAQHVWR